MNSQRETEDGVSTEQPSQGGWAGVPSRESSGGYRSQTPSAGSGEDAPRQPGHASRCAHLTLQPCVVPHWL